MWHTVEPAPIDPILGLTEAYHADPRPGKVNLGVGVYKDENGETPVLESIRQAGQRVLANETTKSYMPIAGDPAYADAVQQMIFGSLCSRSATIHTPGGTAALRVAGELLRAFSSRTLHVSDPTWANHNGVFRAAGIEVKPYPYFDLASQSIDEERFFTALDAIPAQDCVLLHACCHNPTGVDLSTEQWIRVAESAKRNGWTPLVDFAYQGFAESVEADRRGVEILREAGLDFFVASSFSKNFGLYRDRAGALTVVTAGIEDRATAFSHMKAVARVTYSNPPAHGGLLVTSIFADPDLSALWHRELDTMRNRIVQIRNGLADGLAARGVPKDFSFIRHQKGMFSFSGLTPKQVAFLQEEKAIYIVGSGRINVAGLTASRLDAVCDAIAESFSIL